jgi:molybdenum cofactor biosynthesis enzyme MoaA
MENGNPLVRLVTYGKVKKMMKQFQSRDIDPLERNLMRGMFRRKLKDFAEHQIENNEDIPLFDRLKMKKFEEEDMEEIIAKDEFRRKLLQRSLSLENATSNGNNNTFEGDQQNTGGGGTSMLTAPKVPNDDDAWEKYLSPDF